jgi:hypothetical protein
MGDSQFSSDQGSLAAEKVFNCGDAHQGAVLGLEYTNH